MPYVKIGVAGPVGCGKTRLIQNVVGILKQDYSICVVTNDIYTNEDAQYLIASGILDPERIRGVETGGCPHTAIREDVSMNMEAVEELAATFPDTEIVFIESGGDNLAATFSPDLADATIFCIDVAEGGDIPRKGGPGITRSDLLVVNKCDLAPYVEVDLEQLDVDCARMRKDKPYYITNMKGNEGPLLIADWIRKNILLEGL